MLDGTKDSLNTPIPEMEPDCGKVKCNLPDEAFLERSRRENTSSTLCEQRAAPRIGRPERTASANLLWCSNP